MKKLFIFAVLMCGAGLFAQQNEEVVEYVKDGIRYYDEGQYDRALELYDRALDLDKANFPALYEKAMTLNTLRRYDEAIDYCEKALNPKIKACD